MSPFFKDTIAALLHCAQRHTHHEHSKVQISAFEAINDLVRAASRDTLDVVAQLIGVGAFRRVYCMPACVRVHGLTCACMSACERVSACVRVCLHACAPTYLPTCPPARPPSRTSPWTGFNPFAQ